MCSIRPLLWSYGVSLEHPGGSRGALANSLSAGYISMMIPSNMVLSIFKPRIYLPTVVIIWGIVSIPSTDCTSNPDLSQRDTNNTAPRSLAPPASSRTMPA